MSYLTVDRQMPSTSFEKSAQEPDKEDLEVDNSKSVLRKIATLYAEQLMSDLTLEVAGVGYPAHRLILCATSEVFQVMLMNREWNECRKSRIVLQETPTASAVFPHFLKYFYTGQIRISHQTVLPVLSLADKYNVKDLVTLCLSYMSENIAQAAQLGHLIAWMQYTMACGHNDVAKSCLELVKWNMSWVWSEAALTQLEPDAMLQLLQQSDLVLPNEVALYQFASRWLQLQRARLEAAGGLAEGGWEHLVTAVFSHVRFPMMCPTQLATLLLCPLTQEHKEFFMERMAVAMSYQSGQYERIASIQQTEAGRLQFTPRLYTEDAHGSLLSVDNFHSLACYQTRTLIFSSRSSMADAEKQTEWTVDLYPKGVWFPQSMIIMWEGTFDIGILVWGVQKGVEHVASVVERVHRFSSHNQVLNIDGVLDFDELNTPLYTPAAPQYHEYKGKCSKCTESCDVPEPRHLLGPNRDQLRIQVVILPLTDYCHVGPTDSLA